MTQRPQAVNPDVGLQKDSMMLVGGLDLSSPKITAGKGTLLDSSNREIIDRIGYKRIDGFEPFDGRTTPAQTEYFFVDAEEYLGDLDDDFPNGSLLVVADDEDTIFGIVVGRGEDRIFYARINEDAEPRPGEYIAKHNVPNTQFLVNSTGVRVCSKSLGENAAETVSRFNGYNTVLRGFIGSLQDTPVGLHWYRDRLYAVVNDPAVYFSQTVGDEPLLVNSIISKDGGDSTARVLSVQLREGTSWEEGDAEGTIQIEVLTGDWEGSGSCTVTDPALNTEFDLRISAKEDPNPKYASLWRSKSEQQAITEGGNAGWSRIDLGYEVRYEEGLSDTGGFTVVNRGSDNNFEFESSDVEQLPVTIYNGNDISGTTFATFSNVYIETAEKVTNGNPGWKTNVTSTEWASSEQLMDAITEPDADYVYANLMFLSSASNSPFPQAALVADDKAIFGPANFWPLAPTAKPTAVGTETFDDDFLTTNARAPLFLRDFSGVASSIPEGSLIVGIEVEIPKYSVQSYMQGEFKKDRNGIAGANIVSNTVAWLQNAFSWSACLAEATGETSSSIAGDAQTAPLTFPTTGYQTDIQSTASTDAFRIAATVSNQSAIIGGPTNNFGNGALTRTDLLRNDLGIGVFATVNSGPTYPIGLITYSPPAGGSTTLSEAVYGTIRMKVDQIIVRFYYTTPSARYYVGDKTGPDANVCSVDITYYVQEDGSFSAGTAEGTLQFTNIQPVTGGKRTINPGDKIYLTQGDAEDDINAVALISVDGNGAEYNGLPSREEILKQSSRYEFITANFFGRDEWDGFYGVSGAGRAFSFATYDADNDGDNEDYLIQITTSTLDRKGDIPRHIAFHHYALALGFRSGIVRFSVLGEPENFEGVEGAAEMGVGDRVTGLLSMAGTTLGVFCENSIWGIAGTDADNYQTQVLAPYTGAIEYTVVDMGIPVYCDSRGVSTLEQSSKYGNFQGQRLSSQVTQWILPRMVRNNAQFSGIGVVCAIPFRAKNQYVLFFKDGKVLVMTMNPDGSSFTFRNYYIGQSSVEDTGKFMVPFAWSSQVDEKGVDRVHLSHYSPLSSVLPQDGRYVYEMDRGWGFAGRFIPASYTLNWFYQDPFTETVLKKVRLDGLTHGVSSCNLYYAKDYDLEFSSAFSDISLPSQPLPSYWEQPIPDSRISNTAVTALRVSLKVADELPPLTPIENPIPPDTHQAMMVQWTMGKPDR